MTRALRIRPLRRLVGAYAVNRLGDWLGEIALAVLVLATTASALAVAGVLVAGLLVPALVGPLTLGRAEALGRAALPALYAGQALAFAVLAATAERLPLAAILGLVLLDGLLGFAARALSKAAIARAGTAAGCLREANALVNLAFSASCAAGPAVAGV